MLIDAHAHVIPGEFPAAGRAPAAEGWPTMTQAGLDDRLLESGDLRFTAQAVWFDLDRRLAAMDASGVDAEVVSPMPPLLNYRLPAASGRDLARWVNDFIARLCAACPGRLYGLGTVPLQDPGLAAAELAPLLADGLTGVEIASHVNGVSLSDERFAGFFAEAARLGVPIFVHAVSPALGGRVPPAATATFGFAAEIALAASALTASRVPQDCPGLRLAFSHGAGGFPLMLTRAQYFWGRTWNEDPPPPDPARPGRSPAEIARGFWYDTLVFDRRALRYLADMIGPGQLLVGTDFPAMPREDPAGRTLRSLGLPGPLLDDITWHNCFRFLGIEPGTGGLAG